MQALGALYRFATAVLAAAVVVQIGAAGFGAFNAAEHVGKNRPLYEHTFDDGFDFHTGFGYFVFIIGVVAFVLALAARRGRRPVLFSLALAVLVAIQIVLAWAAENHHWVGPFHALLAFVILGFAGMLAARAWRPASPH